jgi:hypothetical protein
LIRIPYLIAKLRVITTTHGIASPKAHGHETTNIEIALLKKKSYLLKII